jgi:dCTP deaminase
MRDDWSESSLFDDEAIVAKRGSARANVRRQFSTGILPHQRIVDLIDAEQIAALAGIAEDQLQPASLDLRLGTYAHRIRASFLPGKKNTLRSQLPSMEMHRLNLEEGAILEKNAVYLVELQESVNLPANIAAIANPKSSTGRIDVFVRLITDLTDVFDYVEPSYSGRLWAEISPRSFAIKVQQGTRLNQLRFRQLGKDQKSSGKQRQHRHFSLSDDQLRAIDDETPLVTGGPKTIQRGLHVSVNLLGENDGIVGYKAKRNTSLIDVENVGQHTIEDFWEPVRAESNGRLILDPLEFYILASQEALSIPPNLAAEMVPIDPLMGEFRVHYAGFFDPGFGYSTDRQSGSRAVLEVRSHEVPFFLEHGQAVGRLVYERLVEVPKRLYGSGIGSNYQGQGLKLSKHFASSGNVASTKRKRQSRRKPRARG